MDVTQFRGAEKNVDGVPLSELKTRYRDVKPRMKQMIASASKVQLGGEDRRVLEAIDQDWNNNLAGEDAPQGEISTHGGSDCAYDPAQFSTQAGEMDALTQRMYSCFAGASEKVVFEGKPLDRLTVMALLSRTENPERRRRLFLSLEQVWKSINGDGRQRSPYRRLLQLRTASWKGHSSPFSDRAQEVGVSLAVVEDWLRQVLAKWKAVTPNKMVEPWDFLYVTGKANRILDPAIPRNALEPLNRRYYGTFGAAPERLGIHFDLAPRSGKDPVAFTTFGARNRYENGAWVQGEFWVFASYQLGGLDNLSELLHETGHGIHIAAIRACPAFEDWPQSDSFNEALADMTGLEVFEPSWQQLYLGVSAPLADSLYAKYSAVVLDIAWSLFEVEMHRNPEQDPNEVWTEITRDYLRIKPHPELSWWAMRGQLINAPGYMLNYGVGSLIAAQLRARVQQLRNGKGFTQADVTWYPWLEKNLYRFGLMRPWRQVFEGFVGTTLSPEPLLADLNRIPALHR